MGHSIGIQDSYYRPTEEDCLKATDLLTVDKSYLLQDQVNQLTERTKDSEEIIESKLQQKDSEILGWNKKYYNDMKGIIEKMNNFEERQEVTERELAELKKLRLNSMRIAFSP